MPPRSDCGGISGGCGMSENWPHFLLGDVVRVEIGGTPSRSNPKYWADSNSTGFPWMSIADLRTKVVTETSERITLLGVQQSNVKLIPAGSVVMSFKLTIGRCAIAGVEMYSNEAIVTCHANTLLIHPEWLYYSLPRSAQSAVTDNAIKGVTLNKSKLASLPLSVPSLDEQRRIAMVLAVIDETIRKTEQVIEKLKQMKQGLLHDLLTRGIDENGELRDPECHPEQFKDSELGRIPTTWTTSVLEPLLESSVDGPFGSNLKSEHYVDGPGVRLVRLQNIGEGLFLDHEKAWISESHARTLAKHDVRPGDVLVASLGDPTHAFARSCLYPLDHAAGIVKADCFRLRTGAGLDSGFLAHLLNTPRWRRGLAGLVHRSGASRDRVNLSKLRRLPIPVAPIREQRASVAMLSACERRVFAETSDLFKLQLLRRGLADDLLTGRVRTTSLLETTP